ncbi:GlxA family transcriptional regulator [Miltoncostaea oceani]|jgi:transcriptional regulator GlxA family with amidase domain|uniref:GlxA family transcriptional regulator n=1 Tax=Miltoncostaea oceani TaxID=2843216 RepID=UPI001C3E6C1D|nr:helix-turn-helix domain-containing protein [Miltoncostaea oceani]
MRIGLAAVDGCIGIGVMSVLDVLQTADALRARLDPAIPAIDVRVVGVTSRVATSSGMVLVADAGLGDLPSFDVVVVCALGTFTTDDTVAALARPDVRSLVGAVTDAGARGVRLAAACTGAFVLAETGLLDGGRATTSWWLGAGFRTRYPRVDLDLDAMVVTDRRAMTAGAAFGHIDLALALLRRHSPALADLTSRMMLADQRPAQSAYIAIGHLEHDDPIVRAFEDHVRAHLGAPMDIAAAARAIGTSRRTLERRVQRMLGLSPLGLVQRLRVERAAHLQATTGDGVDQIAPRVGFANGSTLRALLRRYR